MSYNAAENYTTRQFASYRQSSSNGQSRARHAYDHGHRAAGYEDHRKHPHEADGKNSILKTLSILGAVALATLSMAFAFWILDCSGSLFDELDSPLASGTAISGNEHVNKDSPQSTPIAEWGKGTAPCLYQKDPQWANIEYADGTIGTYGCGPTCLSMAYVALTGKKDKDPIKMAEFSEQNGFIDQGTTSWLLMSEGAEELGLKSKELPASENIVRGELEAGKQVICVVHPGEFTKEGHFIVLTGLNIDGSVEIRDPNSEDHTSTAWDLDRIISQCDNIWSLAA